MHNFMRMCVYVMHIFGMVGWVGHKVSYVWGSEGLSQIRICTCTYRVGAMRYWGWGEITFIGVQGSRIYTLLGIGRTITYSSHVRRNRSFQASSLAERC